MKVVEAPRRGVSFFIGNHLSPSKNALYWIVLDGTFFSSPIPNVFFGMGEAGGGQVFIFIPVLGFDDPGPFLFSSGGSIKHLGISLIICLLAYPSYVTRR